MSNVKTAYGKQQGVSVGYNPHKRGAASYHPLLAFCAETKEILQGWLRVGSAYTSNGVVDPHCHEDKINAATSCSPSKSDSHSVSWRQWFFCGGFAGFPRRRRPWLPVAYNMLRWMALCSGNAILRRWQPATMRTYLVRMAGKWTSGARQQKLRVPERTP